MTKSTYLFFPGCYLKIKVNVNSNKKSVWLKSKHYIPDIVVDGVVDVDDVSLSSFFDDANFPGTQLELFLDFQSFIFFLLFCQTDVRTEYYIYFENNNKNDVFNDAQIFLDKIKTVDWHTEELKIITKMTRRFFMHFHFQIIKNKFFFLLLTWFH